MTLPDLARVVTAGITTHGSGEGTGTDLEMTTSSKMATGNVRNYRNVFFKVYEHDNY